MVKLNDVNDLLRASKEKVKAESRKTSKHAKQEVPSHGPLVRGRRQESYNNDEDKTSMRGGDCKSKKRKDGDWKKHDGGGRGVTRPEMRNNAACERKS